MQLQLYEEKVVVKYDVWAEGYLCWIRHFPYAAHGLIVPIQITARELAQHWEIGS